MFKTAWNKKAKAEGAGTKGKPAEAKAKGKPAEAKAKAKGKPAEEAGVSLDMEVAEAEVVEDALEPEQQAVEVAEAGCRPRAKSMVRPRENAASPPDRTMVHLKRVASKGMGA